jgi:hypothetical protein
LGSASNDADNHHNQNSKETLCISKEHTIRLDGALVRLCRQTVPWLRIKVNQRHFWKCR